MTESKSDGTKKERRFVWIDWLLLILFAAAILFGARFLMRRRDAAQPTAEILYTVCLYAYDSTLSETGDWNSLIPNGAVVSNAMGTAEMGRVTEVTVRQHRTATVRDGEVVMTEVPNRVDLLISVRATATETAGDGFRVKDIRIAAGGTGDFRIGSLYADGARIVSVQRRGSS